MLQNSTPGVLHKGAGLAPPGCCRRMSEQHPSQVLQYMCYRVLQEGASLTPIAKMILFSFILMIKVIVLYRYNIYRN